MQTKERTTLVNKNDGFKKEYPVYRIVDKQAKEYISNYLKYDKSELIPKFQQMQKAFELMKKTYMGKNVQNLKLAGFDLNTVVSGSFALMSFIVNIQSEVNN